MTIQKAAKAAAEEAKATAEGELDVTQKDLAENESNLATARSTCQDAAASIEDNMKTRGEELDTSSGAVSQTYDFLQVSMQPSADLANAEVVTSIKRLAENITPRVCRSSHRASLRQSAMVGAIVTMCLPRSRASSGI